MRKTLFACFIALLFSCGEDDGALNTDGHVSAQFNGERQWTTTEVYTAVPKPGSDQQLCPDNLVDIIVAKFNHLEEGYINTNEKVYVSSIPLEPGVQYLNDERNCNGVTRYYTLVGDDALADVYVPDTSEANWINIEAIDQDEGTFSGSFEMHFVIDPNRQRSEQDWPDTIHLTDGTFTFKIPADR